MPFARSFYQAAPVIPRLARCLRVLAAEIDAAWPDRDTTLDGWIGDKAHSLRVSDHNPDRAGIVRALDVTALGINTQSVLYAAIRHPACTYVIWNGRIWSRDDEWRPNLYHGPNQHTTHMHISCSSGRNAAGSRPWGIVASPAPRLR